MVPKEPKGWGSPRIREIAKTYSGGTPSRSRPEYFGGNIPWIKSGELNREIIKFTEEKLTEEGLKNSSAKWVPKGSILIAMYGATAGKVATLEIDATINQAILAIIPEKRHAYYYVHLAVRSVIPALLRRLQGSGQPNLNAQLIGSARILLPPLPEQRKIAAILSTWDRAVEQTQKLIDAKTRLKRSLMQQLLTGKRRFGEFAKSNGKVSTRFGERPSDWDLIRVGEIANEVTSRNIDGHEIPVLSCTKYDGLVDSLKYFGKQVFSRDTSNYKVVRRNQFAYATNHIEEGSIGLLSNIDCGLVSPMYTVFEVQEGVNPLFLFKLFKTELYRHIFEVSTNASVNRRGSLRWKQFSRIQIALPSLEEQMRINSVIQDLDSEVTLRKKLLTKLQAQKNALMQVLLTGKVRVKL